MNNDRIAALLRYCINHCDNEDETAIVVWIVGKFADDLMRDNNGFNYASFMRDCDVTS